VATSGVVLLSVDAVATSGTGGSSRAAGVVARATILVGVDARVSLIGKIGRVRASGVRGWAGTAAEGTSTTNAVTVVQVGVDTGINLVGDVGGVRTGVSRTMGLAVGGTSTTDDTTSAAGMVTGAVKVRIDTRVGLVSNVGRVRASSVGSRASSVGRSSTTCTTDAAHTGTNTRTDTTGTNTASTGTANTVAAVEIRVDTGVSLVGNVGGVRAGGGGVGTKSSTVAVSGTGTTNAVAAI